MSGGRNGPAQQLEPVTVLVVDDHPALRQGLEGLLEEAAGFRPLGALPGAAGVLHAIDTLRPDVLLLDYALGEGDGLSVCFRVKQRPAAPGVVLYSAYVDAVFAVPAALAQADAMVSKTAPVAELLDVVRDVGARELRMPSLDPRAVSAAFSRLSPDDLPVAGLLLSRVGIADIASTLGIGIDDARGQALRIIGELQARDRVGARASR